MAIKNRGVVQSAVPNERKTPPSVVGLDSPLQLTVLEMPVLACPKNTRRRCTGIQLWLIGGACARVKGQIRGRQGRGHDLQEVPLRSMRQGTRSKSERRQAYPYELKYEELAPFKVEIEMPLYKCTGCGKEQLRSTKAAARPRRAVDHGPSTTRPDFRIAAERSAILYWEATCRSMSARASA
jgi:hypothetical protein